MTNIELIMGLHYLGEGANVMEIPRILERTPTITKANME